MREDEADSDDLSSSLSDLADSVGDDRESATASSSTDREGTSSLTDLAESIADRHSGGAGERLGTDASGGDEWDLVSPDDATGETAALDAKTEAVLELVGDAANVLVSGPSGTPAEERLCSRLMTPRSTDPVNLLVVTITETPSERLAVLENYLGAPVDETVVVDVRNYNREPTYERYDGPVDVRTVSSPRDLRRIGIVTSKALSEWDASPNDATLCFHSLSALLSLMDDRERLFRFLHVLRGRVQAAGARAHFHFDPAQHHDQIVHTFESLFDTVVEFEADGAVSLK